MRSSKLVKKGRELRVPSPVSSDWETLSGSSEKSTDLAELERGWSNSKGY